MKVMVLAPFFVPGTRGGGPIRTLVALLSSAPCDVEQLVFTRSHDLGESKDFTLELDSWLHGERYQVFYASGPPLARNYRMWRQLCAKRPDVLYVNSLFDPGFSWVPQLLSWLGLAPKRILLAPRGELGQGALAIKWPLKRLVLSGYRRLGWHRRIAWHASSSAEVAEILRVFPDVNPDRIHVVLDETDLPEVPAAPHAEHEGPLRLIFASRVVPKKGLDVLLKALAGVTTAVELRIIGPLEDAAYVAQCKHLADAASAVHRIEFCGPVGHDVILNEFRNADAFVFPTASENFGHVIAEALAMSCPVLLADVTPWTTVLDETWRVPSRAPMEWTTYLQQLADLSSKERSVWSLRANDVYRQWRLSLSDKHIFDVIRQARETEGG